jgi:hypothetical protein
MRRESDFSRIPKVCDGYQRQSSYWCLTRAAFKETELLNLFFFIIGIRYETLGSFVGSWAWLRTGLDAGAWHDCEGAGPQVTPCDVSPTLAAFPSFFLY